MAQQLASGRPTRFWLASQTLNGIFLTLLVLVGLFRAVEHWASYWATLVATGSALLLCVFLAHRDRSRALTPAKLLAILHTFYAVAVNGSVIFLEPIGLPFRDVASGNYVVLAAALCSLYFHAISCGMRLVPNGKRWAHEVGAESMSRNVGWLALTIGSGAMLVRFSSPQALRSYWAGEAIAGSSGIIGLLSSLGRPLLPIGMFILMMTSRRKFGPVRVLGTALVAVLVLGTYGFNRAAIILPFIAVALLLGKSGRRFPWVAAMGVASLAAYGFVVLGKWRTHVLATSTAVVADDGWLYSLTRSVQVYGQAPHIAAEGLSNEVGLSWGSFLASFLSPIPGISEAVRNDSGTALFNYHIYGRLPVRDQILPVWAEFWAVGGPLLLLAFGVLTGGVIARLHSKYQRSRNTLLGYGCALTVAWLSFSPFYSITATLQSLIFFCLPCLLLGYLSWPRIDGESNHARRRASRRRRAR